MPEPLLRVFPGGGRVTIVNPGGHGSTIFEVEITGIPNLLYDPDYVGGGTHQNLHGQDLDPHVDFNYHPKNQRHRRLNLIVFLNPEWREEWGGAFELHVNPWLPPEEDTVKTIVPITNRCLLFETSENSWHGFRRINLPPEKKHLSRRSIAVYYYTSLHSSQQSTAGCRPAPLASATRVK